MRQRTPGGRSLHGKPFREGNAIVDYIVCI